MNLRLLFFFLIPCMVAANTSNFSAFTSYDKKKSVYTHQKYEGPTFKGLFLQGSRAPVHSRLTRHDGVATYDLVLPGSIVSLKRQLGSFLAAPLDKQTILAIRSCVLQFYIDHGHPFIEILIPEQNLNAGVLHLTIKEARLGKITLEGDKHSLLAHDAKKKISLVPGEAINTFALSRDLLYLNQNPFFEVDAIYYPGNELLTTNIALRVKEKKCWRFFTGIDNTGNDITGNNRLFAGLSLGNLFNTPQSLSYQFMCAPQVKHLTTHILDYNAPLPWKHTLRLFAGLSFINAPFDAPGITQTRFKTKGHNLQTSLRYEMPILSRSHLVHEAQAGFDYKRTNNNLLFSERAVYSRSEVNLAQFAGIYSLGYDTASYKIGYNIEGFFSPGDWLPSQSRSDYASLRPGSSALYAYLRTALKTSLMTKQGSFVMKAAGQLSTSRLLPSEQYGLGGLRTVRGYKERIINGDDAILLNFEYHTPYLSLIELLSSKPKARDIFKVIAFYDYGLAITHSPYAYEKKSEYLSSIGAGLHYQIIPYMNVAAYWGYQLHSVPYDMLDQRLHFTFTASY